jgi:hypothetical protein
MVHSGDYDAYEVVSPQVISIVESLLAKHSTANVVVTGHSLGAALATFAAVDIKAQISIASSKIIFYTFGSPRTGNQAFTDYVFSLYPNGGYQRVTHFDDGVPVAPAIVFGYNHAGDEVWYSSSDFNNLTYKVCRNKAGQSESRECLNSLGFPIGKAAHLNYVGHNMTGNCAKPLTTGEQFAPTTTSLFLKQ